MQTELTIRFLGDERTTWQYPFASLQRAGAVLAGGSDWPVSTPDPIHAIHVAVNRRLHGEERPAFGPDEAITLAEGLAADTSGAAWANGLDGGARRPDVAGRGCRPRRGLSHEALLRHSRRQP